MAKQRASSEQLLKEKLLQDPNDIKTRFQLAKLLFEKNRLKLALKHAKMILEDRPNHKNAEELKEAIKKAQASTQREEKIEKLPGADAAAEPDILGEGAAAEPDILGAGAAAELDILGNDEWELL